MKGAKGCMFGKWGPAPAAAEEWGADPSAWGGDEAESWSDGGAAWGGSPWGPDPTKGKGKAWGCGFDFGGKKGFKGKSFGKDGFKGGCKGGGKGGKGGKGSMVTQKIMAGEPVFTGQIKSFIPEKKHGHIVCEAIYNQCGQDVYCFQDVMERAGAGPGDLVAFFVHWSAKGQPQASSPLLRLSCPDEHVLKGSYKPAKDAEKGFSFIECAETKEMFGRDVYVHKEMAMELEAGTPVKFNVYLNRDGFPNVETMEPCDPDWLPAPSDLTIQRFADVAAAGGGAKGKGGFGGKGKGCWGGWGGEAEWGGGKCGKALARMKGFGKGCKGKGKVGGAGAGGPPPTSTGKVCIGTIKSFNEMNNYGFIDCPEVKAEYGNDVWVHGKGIAEQGLAVGQMVQFELGVSSRGQPQAMDVQAADGGDGSAWGPPAKKAKVATAGLEGLEGLDSLEGLEALLGGAGAAEGGGAADAAQWAAAAAAGEEWGAAGAEQGSWA